MHAHTLTVRNHRISCDSPVLVQRGMGHDAISLDLDAEWDGLAVRLVLGPCGAAYDALYEGAPVTVPASSLAEPGWLPVSVVGYGEDGAVRVTTERCDHLLRVVASGCVDGSVPPEDQPDLLGQLVAAGQKATDAAEAANDAVAKVDEAVSDLGDAAASAAAARESAEAAAKSASDAGASESSARASAESASADASAASSSEAAARQSATEAKASADTAAGWVPADGEPGQLLAKTDSGTAWVDPPSTGNVLTGEAEGYVAHAEDAYAAKPREVRIKGRTVKNLWPVFTETTTNGVTITCDETGLFTLSGTATSLTIFSNPVNGLAAGRKVALSKSGGTGFTAFLTVGSSTQNTAVSVGTSNTSTGTIASDATAFNAHIRVESGTAVNASFRVMLVEGTEAPDCFTPPSSITSVQTGNLVTSGKNLLKSDKMTQSASNNVSDYVHLPAGTYTFSASGGPFGQIIIESDVQEISPNNFSVSKATFTLPYSEEIRVRTWNNAANSVFTFDPQIELGSTATAYEPPNITTTPLPEVELRGLPNGTCDELVIGADGTCEVERKTVEVTFDGSEDENWGDAATYPGVFQLEVDGVDYTNIGIVSDRYSTATGFVNIGDKQCAVSGGALRFGVKDSTYENAAAFKASLATNPLTVIFGGRNSTEPQSPVTLPALPAPTFNQYHDGDVLSDTSTEYARDINIAFEQLEAKIAALTVAQATS